MYNMNQIGTSVQGARSQPMSRPYAPESNASDEVPLNRIPALALFDSDNNYIVSPPRLTCDGLVLNLTPNSTGQLCRICLEGDTPTAPLVSLCHCSGTVGLVHKKCIEYWLGCSNTNTCDLCGYQYTVVKKSQSAYDWFMKSKSQRNDFLADLGWLALIFPLDFGSLTLCLYEASQRQTIGGALCLYVIAFLLCLVFVVWSSLVFKVHHDTCMIWRQNHPYVNIVVGKQEIMNNIYNTSSDPALTVPQSDEVVQQ